MSDPFNMTRTVDKAKQKRQNIFASKLYYFLIDEIEAGGVPPSECLGIMETMLYHLRECNTPHISILDRGMLG